MTLVDTHCHLDSPKFAADFDQILERAQNAGVERMLSIGTGEGPGDLDCALKIASRYAHVFATSGIHPHDAGKADEASFRWLEALSHEPKCLAIGETGLDYHYDFAPRDVQVSVFTRQLAIARAAAKPVVIHSREAWPETVSVLRAHWQGGTGVLHCFTGTAEQALEAVDLGFYLGFGGVLTFPKSDGLRDAARAVPLHRLLLETDAPFLAPVPHRGKRNEPAFTAHTAATLAQVRGCSLEEIAQATSSNFDALFHYTEGSHGTR